MTSSAPFAHRPAPHPGLRAAAVVQLVVTGLACLGYAVTGVGVAMCSDGGSAAYCGRVDTDYQLTGWALLLNGVVGLTTVLAVRRPRSGTASRVLVAGVVVGLVALAVTGAVLWSVSTGPIT